MASQTSFILKRAAVPAHIYLKSSTRGNAEWSEENELKIESFPANLQVFRNAKISDSTSVSKYNNEL